ncbi:AAA family ATPase [Yoonia sp.]|uniref:AAA family ATPase n=1 Tax=Yoonia sp. TaxID=2212373 RepID=UPI00391C7BA1
MMDGHSMGQTAEGPQAAQFATYTAMKGVPRWLLWKEVPQEGRKALKVPHYVNGSKRGATDTPDDWAQLTSYDAAKAALARAGLGWGLAFALGPDGSGGHWQGIDLDDIAANRLADLANTVAGYVEVSPSGQGAHAVGYGRHFAALGSNATGIEAYAASRFFTVTERPIRDSGLICLAAHVEGQLAPRHALGRAPTANIGAPVEVVQVDAKTVSELRSALMHMRADDYHVWIRMGLALRELGEAGRGLWLNWSTTSDKFDPKQAAKKWDGFAPSGTGYQAVFAEAQKAGWVNPASNAAQLPVTSPVIQPAETPAQMLARLCVDWEGDDDAEVPDIVDGLVADEDVTLLGGHGGVGKSFLAMQMACAVALGETIIGCNTRQSRVLYYSAEDGRKRLKRRLRRVTDTFDYDSEGLRGNLLVLDASEVEPLYGEGLRDVGASGKPHMMKHLGDTATFRNLQAMVETFDPQLVIIDGASDTFDGNEIARREVRAFIKLLRQVHPARKIGVMLLVHIDRASARGYSSNDDGYAGSAQWHNSCRRRMFLQQKVEKDDDDGSVISETFLLRVMKNTDGQPMPDMELARGEFGLWQRGVHFSGDLTGNPEPDPRQVIAELIGEYYDRGQFISTSLAANASTGTHATLSGDPRWPRRLRKAKQTNEVVRGNHAIGTACLALWQ